jgi:hypothetical protein
LSTEGKERSGVPSEALGPGDWNGEAPESTQLHGHYANYFEVGHNAVEFLIDFGQLYADKPAARFHTRIVTSPTYAVELLRLLQQAIDQYRRNFGAIPGRT